MYESVLLLFFFMIIGLLFDEFLVNFGLFDIFVNFLVNFELLLGLFELLFFF